MKFHKILLLFLLLSTIPFVLAQNGVILCKTNTEVDLKTFADTYEKSEDVFKTLHVTKKIKASSIGSPDKKMELSFNIYATKSGSKIYTIYNEYIPKEDEILFLFENDDPVGEFSDQSIFFKFGTKISTALKNKIITKKDIVGFLKCAIFRNEPFFFSDKVFDALQFAEEKYK